MRKWILLFILAFEVFGAMALHADTRTTSVWLSSYTETADTTQRIACSTVVNGGGCFLHSIVVDSTGTTTAFLTIYNSSSTAVNKFAFINTMQQGPYVYDVYLSSGLVYTNAGTVPAKLHILYAKPTIR